MRNARRELEGIVVGLFATAALTLLERFEWRILGRKPVYAPSKVAASLGRRWGFGKNPRVAAKVGLALRWVYGPVLGVLFHVATPARRRASIRAAVSHSALIYGFELVAMPLTGASPPLGEWEPNELLLLAAHTSLFAAAILVAETAIGQRDPDC
jgi:hypothetical protein